MSKLSPPAGVRECITSVEHRRRESGSALATLCPGDSERNKAKAVDCGADALLLDPGGLSVADKRNCPRPASG